MQSNCIYLPYSSTGYFSKIVIDYLQQDEKLKSFFTHPLSLKGVENAIENKKSFAHRSVLTEQLQLQYEGIAQSGKLSSNIQLLSKQNTFTITTAHQPNIFLGPLYVIYKILHTIKLANELTVLMPQHNFVPVFYMGSEDADIDELGNITIDSKKYEWQTKQTGAVGRMKVDKAFRKLIEEMQSQLAVQEHGAEIITIFKTAYTERKTIQQATLELINILFGEYGLVVLIPDNATLKKIFQPIAEKELKEQFSHKAAEITIQQLGKLYKVQAGGRELNLFYLIDDKRERIEVSSLQSSVFSFQFPVSSFQFSVSGLNVQWTMEEILEELNNYPERFSTNVILRGLFQETILPNIAFIGGGGEIAYWLELKNVFAAVNISFPLLILRNSFLVIEEKWNELLQTLEIQLENVFLSEHEIIKQVITKRSNYKTDLSKEISEIEKIYSAITDAAALTDKSLQEHVYALKTNTIRRLHELEKKLLRAEKRKFSDEQRQIQKIKTHLFPNNGLQERVENIAGFYSKYGKAIIEIMLRYSTGLQQEFGIINLE